MGIEMLGDYFSLPLSSTRRLGEEAFCFPPRGGIKGGDSQWYQTSFPLSLAQKLQRRLTKGEELILSS